MKKLILCLFLAVCFAGCTQTGQSKFPLPAISAEEISYGTIISVELVDITDHTQAAMSEAGAAFLGGLFDTFGSSVGVSGSAGKAMTSAMNSAEKHATESLKDGMESATQAFKLEIKLDRKREIITIYQEKNHNYREGQKVQIIPQGGDFIVLDRSV